MGEGGVCLDTPPPSKHRHRGYRGRRFSEGLWVLYTQRVIQSFSWPAARLHASPAAPQGGAGADGSVAVLLVAEVDGWVLVLSQSCDPPAVGASDPRTPAGTLTAPRGGEGCWLANRRLTQGCNGTKHDADGHACPCCRLSADCTPTVAPPSRSCGQRCSSCLVPFRHRPARPTAALPCCEL